MYKYRSNYVNSKTKNKTKLSKTELAKKIIDNPSNTLKYISKKQIKYILNNI